MEEACEYGLPRGTCFVERRLVGRGRRAAVDFVVCFGLGGFIRFFLVFISSYFAERTRPTASTSSALPHVPLY